MLVRRRPLLRAAAVGGGAYLAGKARQRSTTEREQREQDQEARISQLEAQQGPGTPAPQSAPQPAPAAGPPPAASMSDQLTRLSELHEQGVLTDAEFAAAKAKLLGI